MLHSDQEAKILAGGQSLTSLMKLRIASPQTLVDINGLKDLTYVREEAGEIKIGALVRHDQVERDPIMRNRMPLLCDAAALIADQQIRNRGTIGGSLAHADPAADFPTALSALDAIVNVRSVTGSRSIKIDSFFRDYFTTALTHDEILCEVIITIPKLKYGNAYLKLSKAHNDFAVVSAASQLLFNDDKVCTQASIVLGGVAPTPVHAQMTEELLKGNMLNEELIERSSEKASDGLNPGSDIRASAEYRLKMAKKLVYQTVKTAIKRSEGEK